MAEVDYCRYAAAQLANRDQIKVPRTRTANGDVSTDIVHVANSLAWWSKPTKICRDPLLLLYCCEGNEDKRAGSCEDATPLLRTF